MFFAGNNIDGKFSKCTCMGLKKTECEKGRGIKVRKTVAGNLDLRANRVDYRNEVSKAVNIKPKETLSVEGI